MVIEQISQMKQQGMPTNEIIQNLKQQGVTPKEINEALSQSEIKSEINNNQNIFPGNPESNMQQPTQQQTPTNIQPQTDLTSTQQAPSTAPMQPSIGQQPQANMPTGMTSNMQSQSTIPPATNSAMPPSIASEIQSPMDMQQGMIEPATQDYSQYQEYSSEGEYYPEYQQPGGADIETINDISTQLIDEKTKHFKKEFTDFTSFKKESQNKLEQLDKRLTKIEDHIEELKMAIIRKIGEYGDDIKNLSSEMKATQDSFGKIINPLTKKAKKAQETQKEEPKTETKSKAQKATNSDSFEDYLR